MTDRSLMMPPKSLMLWELRLVLELVASFLPRPFAASPPRGHGEPVLVIPGFAADDLAVRLLVGRLRRLGYAAESWGLGRNTGNLKRLQPLLVERLQQMHAAHGRKIRIVGWSLGGAMARDLAREHAGCVEQLVTLGSPVVGGAKFTAVGRRYAREGVDLDRMAGRRPPRDGQDDPGAGHRVLRPPRRHRPLERLHRPPQPPRPPCRGAVQPSRHGRRPHRVQPDRRRAGAALKQRHRSA